MARTKKISITGKQVRRAIAEYLCNIWNRGGNVAQVEVSERELDLMSEITHILDKRDADGRVRFFLHPITCECISVVVGASCISMVG